MRPAMAAAWLAGLLIATAPAMAQDAPKAPPSLRDEVVEANQARVSELDGLRGIGPALSARVLAARAQRPFDDWTDLRQRVGVGAAQARRLSDAGLRVNGQPLPVDP